jgi:hypothetical protein
MQKKRTKKTFGQMSFAERDAYVRQFDAETSYEKTKPLSAHGKALWKAAKRGRPRKNPGEKASRMLISVEPTLLAAADDFARQHGKSRSQLVAEGLRLAMGVRRAKAS